MANSVLIKLQADNKLTPELEKAKGKLKELDSEISKLNATMQKIRADKPLIVSGELKSDIAGIKQLQDELTKLKNSDAKSSEIRKKQQEITRALANETARLTQEKKKLTDISKIESERARTQINQLNKTREAQDRANRSLRDSNAIRNSTINGIVRHVRQLETLAVSVFAVNRAYKITIGAGIELQRNIENQVTGIAALITANTRMAQSGISAAQHFENSMKKSTQVIQQLRKASIETAATFTELTAVFQQAIGGALGSGEAMGKTLDEQITNTINLAKRMTNIAASIGMPMVQVNEEIRSIIEGTIDINSRIAKMIGITSEEVKNAKKEAGGLVKYLDEKLKAFDTLAGVQTFDRALARIRDTWQTTIINGTNEGFLKIKASLNDLNKYIAQHADTISRYMTEGMELIFVTIPNAIKKVISFTKEWKNEIMILLNLFAVFKVGGWLSTALGGKAKKFKELAATIVATATATGRFNVVLTATRALMRTFLPTALLAGLVELALNLDKIIPKLKSFGDSYKIAFGQKVDTSDMTIERKREVFMKMNAELLDLEKKINNIKLHPTGDKEQDEAWLELYVGRYKRLAEAHKKLADELYQHNQELAKKNQELSKSELAQMEADMISLQKLSEDAKKSLKDFGEGIFDKTKREIADLKKQLEEFARALASPDITDEYAQKLSNTIEGIEKLILEKEKKLSDDRKNEQKRRAEEYKRWLTEKLDAEINYYKVIGDTERQHTAEMKKLRAELDDKIARGILTRKQANDLFYAEEKKHLDDIIKKEQEREEKRKQEREKQLDLTIEIYKKLGDMDKVRLAVMEKVKNKVAEITKILKLTANEQEKLTKILFDEGIGKAAEKTKKQIKEMATEWENVVSSMSKTIEDKFFDFLIGKTKSFSHTLKDIGTNLMRDLISPYARSFSKGLGSIFGGLLGGKSNLADLASAIGLTKDDKGGFGGTIGGTAVEILSDGTISKGNSAFGGASNLISMASNLKSAYSLLSGGYQNFLGSATSPFTNIGAWFNGAGFSGTGQFFNGIGNGARGFLGGNATSPIAGSYYGVGSAVGGGLAGAGIGYAAGTLGDRLTGTQTKAGLGGAIGGGIGGGLAAAGLVSNPVGWVIGAIGLIVGSFISKAKTTDAGLFLKNAIGAALDEKVDTSGVKNYTEKTSRNWWRKKVSWEYGELDSQTKALLDQSSKAVQLSLKGISATNGLLLSAGHFSANSFLNDNLALAALSSFTGLARNFSDADGERGTIKKWNLSNIFGGIGQKKLFDAFGKLTGEKSRKALLAGFYGAAPQLGFIDKTDDIAKTPAQIEAENARLVEMRKSFENYANQNKKQVIEVIIESLNSVNQAVFDLELNGTRNPIEKASKAIRKAIDVFKVSSDGAFDEFGDVLSISAEQFKNKYLEILRQDFTKENVDRLNAAKQAYEVAKKAQEDYIQSVLAFTQQIHQTQTGFYGAFGLDTNVMAFTSAYDKFNTLRSALSGDLAGHYEGIKSKGSPEDIMTWAKYFLSFTNSQMQEFLRSGNVEMRKALIDTITEYQKLTIANGGKEFWTKPMVELDALNKQIAIIQAQIAAENGLTKDPKKLAELERKRNLEALDAQKQLITKSIEAKQQELSLLQKQRQMLSRIDSIVRGIRNQVIDNVTSTINYQNALKAAKDAYNRKDYGSSAFGNLGEAANKQAQFYENTSKSYEDYKLAMLQMAGEIEGIAKGITLADIEKAIAKAEKEIEALREQSKLIESEIKKLGKKTEDAIKDNKAVLQEQLAAMETQRNLLIQQSKDQIKALDDLYGSNTALNRYLHSVLEALINLNKPKDEHGRPINPETIKPFQPPRPHTNNGVTTKNGAVLLDDLDKRINEAYKIALFREAEQGGLSFWKSEILSGRVKEKDLIRELIATAERLLGKRDKENWINEYRKMGLTPLAKGGIVTKATPALVGEAGREAVVPLERDELRVNLGSSEFIFRELLYNMKETNKNTRELSLILQGVVTEDGEHLNIRSGK